MKTALVTGAGGFIGSYLVKRLKAEGYWVRAVDLKYPEFSKSEADEFIIGDLREQELADKVTINCSELYQLAADMGGMGYISGEHDFQIMNNSIKINANILKAAELNQTKKIFFSSSACVYPKYIQSNTENLGCKEDSAYPADPDSNYGWEKLFSERMYLAFKKAKVSIARFHNVFGPEGTYQGGKEKAPAALCRKVALAKDGASIEIWGDGQQTRSFLYIDECIEGIRRLMESSAREPINIGSDELISINDLALLVAKVADKKLSLIHVEGPQGVRGRNSDNTRVQEVLGWKPKAELIDGITKTYRWISQELEGARNFELDIANPSSHLGKSTPPSANNF